MVAEAGCGVESVEGKSSECGQMPRDGASGDLEKTYHGTERLMNFRAERSLEE